MKKHAPVVRREPSPSTLTASPAPSVVAGAEAIRDVEKRIRRNEERIRSNKAARENTAGIRETKKSEIAAIRTATPEDINARLARGRRCLLAKVALGTATEADLAKFDQDAAEEQRAFAAQSGPREAIRTLEDTVAGLDEAIGKLDAEGKALVAERDALVAERDAAWGRYLRECAEADGAEYRDHAAAAFKFLLRIVNLGAFLHRLEGRPNAIALGSREFAIPSLGTESTRLPPEKRTALGVDTNLFSITSDENLRKHVEPVEGTLFEEFEKAGLKCPDRLSPAPVVSLRRVPGIGEGTPVPVARPMEPLRGVDGCLLPAQAITEAE